MALAFEGAQSAALSNRRAVTAIIASTLSWSLDMFDLFILPYVVPAHSHDFRQGSDSTVRRCGRHVRSTPDRYRMLQRGLRGFGPFPEIMARKVMPVASEINNALAERATRC